jgi:hypothetical protein
MMNYPQKAKPLNLSIFFNLLLLLLLIDTILFQDQDNN